VGQADAKVRLCLVEKVDLKGFELIVWEWKGCLD